MPIDRDAGMSTETIPGLIPPPLPEIVEAWAEWMGRFSWDSFWTLTTEKEYSPLSLSRAIKRWARRHVASRGDEPAFIFFQDWGRNGRLHAHGLIGTEMSRRTAMWADWHKHQGRCRGEPYMAHKGARFYCAKYLTKTEGEAIVDDNMQGTMV